VLGRGDAGRVRAGGGATAGAVTVAAEARGRPLSGPETRRLVRGDTGRATPERWPADRALELVAAADRRWDEPDA
jgi:hypothetical protein